MTPERASELIESANEWPFWGNYTRLATPDEKHELTEAWQHLPGNWSVASLLHAIARRGDVTTLKLL